VGNIIIRLLIRMPTTEQISNFLFKRALRVAETNTDTEFFSEPLPSNVPLYPNQIWADKPLIPATAPVLTNGATDGSGTVQYWEKLSLTTLPSGVAFYDALLINAIPFNYDTAGSYNYKLYQSDGTTQIFFGQGDWVLDNASGVLYFYGTLPGGMPPKITFYKYVGALGLTSSGSTDANGITITTDGPGGTNPVNKATSAITDAYYIRGANGLILLGGANPPGGLSDTAPYGAIDNDANMTTIMKKIQTVGAVAVPLVSFPSHPGNRQSYSVKIWAHGTSTAGLSTGKLIFKEIRFIACESDPATLPSETTLETIEGSSIDVAQTISGYDVSITGVAGYTIDWIAGITFTQYRIS